MLEWLAILFMFELGTIDGAMVQYEPNLAIEEVVPFYSTLGVRGEVGPFYVSTKTRSDFRMIDPVNYTPTQQTFVFGAGLEYKGFTVGYEHSCFHPIVPYSYTSEFENYQVTPKFEGGYDKFFVRCEIKIGKR